MIIGVKFLSLSTLWFSNSLNGFWGVEHTHDEESE